LGQNALIFEDFRIFSLFVPTGTQREQALHTSLRIMKIKKLFGQPDVVFQPGAAGR
jgi:hypothetical protein